MRRTFVWITAALFVVGSMAGCPDPPQGSDAGDTEADTTADTNTPEDTETPEDTSEPNDTSDEDTSEDTTADTSEDTGAPDTAADTGPGNDTASDTGGTDTLTDTGVATDTAGDTSINRDTLPSNFGPGSFIDSFYIDKQNPGTPRCCFDLDSDPQIDNDLADFLANYGSIAGFGIGDVNSTINAQIQGGNLVFLFEYQNWSSSNWQNDSMITMYAHPAQDAQSPFSDNLNGTGDFEILPKSYDANGNPKSEFQSASTSSRQLTASNGTLLLPLDFGRGLQTTLEIKRAQLEAMVDTSATVSSGGRVPLNQGKLGGIIQKGELYEGINNATSNCSCLGGQKLITPVSAPDDYQCTTPSGSCSCSTSQIISFCSTITTGVTDEADVDTNSNGTDDALTIGASFTAVGAKIVGVAP